MASLWFLKLLLNCLDHLAWPLLALAYPLCASVQAIESDSYKETKDLISYWIFLSLIYLFEYAFSRLLLWFQFWPYIKLMIIFWLIIPDFGQASNAYNYLIRSCISFNLQAVICRLNNWRKFFVKKDNFLLHAESYVQENGTEALEKLIASKNTTDKPGAEATNAIRASGGKEKQQTTTTKPYPTRYDPTSTNLVQTNEEKLQTEHKAIKDLEMIDKKEIPVVKQGIPIVPNLAPSQNAPPAMVETKAIVGKDIAVVVLPQSSTHKEVQLEWACALCHVATWSLTNLNMHLQGKKHKATCEALKAKNQPVPQKQKSDQSKEELKQSNINYQGKKHKATCEALKAKNQPVPQKQKSDQSKEELKQSNINYQVNSKTKNGESIVNNGLKGGKEVMDHHKVQKLKKKAYDPAAMNHSKFRCEVCNVNCPCGITLASHKRGKKHLANINNLS